MTTQPARALTAIDAEALRTRSRADFVFDSLRDAISDGRIAVGERVREEEIARNLGVSRTPVREALQRLHQRGLLVFGAGRGLVVAELSQHQVLQLYAMREILEGSAARFAAQHANATDIAILYRLQKELAEAKPDATAAGDAQPPLPSGDLRGRAQSVSDADAQHAARLARAAAQRDVPRAEPPLRVRRGASPDRRRDRAARPRCGRGSGARAHPPGAAHALRGQARRRATPPPSAPRPCPAGTRLR